MQTTIQGVTIDYEMRGPGHPAGIPVVMLHGWGVDRHLMLGCMEPVMGGPDSPWQRIYFDLPGMGRTPGASWITGSDDLLGVLLAFLDEILAGRRFVLVGESYGGYLARGVLRARPQQVAGLALICPVYHPDTREANCPPLTVLERDEALLAELSAADLAQLTFAHTRQTRPVWQRFQADVLPGLLAADQDFLQNCLGRQVPFAVDVDQVEQPYSQPTLILLGRQDSMAGYREQWQLVENFPRGTLALLDKAGHNLQFEQPELFEALVREWLERVERG